MKTVISKITSLLLVVALVVGLAPMTAFAAEPAVLGTSARSMGEPMTPLVGATPK